jgi:hypothetical protein
MRNNIYKFEQTVYFLQLIKQEITYITIKINLKGKKRLISTTLSFPNELNV